MLHADHLFSYIWIYINVYKCVTCYSTMHVAKSDKASWALMHLSPASWPIRETQSHASKESWDSGPLIGSLVECVRVSIRYFYFKPKVFLKSSNDEQNYSDSPLHVPRCTYRYASNTSSSLVNANLLSTNQFRIYKFRMKWNRLMAVGWLLLVGHQVVHGNALWSTQPSNRRKAILIFRYFHEFSLRSGYWICCYRI